MKVRYSKTVSQQCRYYEVENIFEYMVSVYLNGNISTFTALFKELEKEARKDFIDYLFKFRKFSLLVLICKYRIYGSSLPTC